MPCTVTNIPSKRAWHVTLLNAVSSQWLTCTSGASLQTKNNTGIVVRLQKLVCERLLGAGYPHSCTVLPLDCSRLSCPSSRLLVFFPVDTNTKGKNERALFVNKHDAQWQSEILHPSEAVETAHRRW